MSNLESFSPENELKPQHLAPGEVCVNVEEMQPREVPLGGPRAMSVYRTLPYKGRPFIGAWCFLDHYGPDDVAATGGMDVARHPHTGLATVSWLFEGEINHLDSAGNRAVVKPGELNLMVAGQGITHQEISTPETSTLHGVQLWYALPEQERFREHGFSHYVPEVLEGEGYSAKVFIGSLFGLTSPVQTHTTDLLGAEIIMAAGTKLRLQVNPDFEHGALAENSHLKVNGLDIAHRSIGYVPKGADVLELEALEDVRVILLGGEPFGEEIVMWWNFIGRTHEEIVEFRRRYQAEIGLENFAPEDEGKPLLFGPYPDHEPSPLPAPAMPGLRLKPRGNQI